MVELRASEYWESLQLGNLPEKAIQIGFRAKVIALIVFFIYLYFMIALFLLIFPEVSAVYPDVRFLFNPISLMLGFISTLILFAFSFQSYFLQQATRHKVITCPGSYQYEGEEGLIFFVNRGETTVFRDVSLFALKEGGPIRGVIESKLYGIPSFEIFTTYPLFQGLMILPTGDSIAFRKDDVIKGIKGLYHDFSLRHPNFHEDPQVCVLAFNEEVEPTKPKTYSTTLVAGSLLGQLSDLSKYANGELDHLPCDSIGSRMYFEFFGDISKAKAGQRIPAKFIRESVIIPPLWSREIWNKLDSLYNKLDSIENKLSGRKRSKKRRRK